MSGCVIAYTGEGARFWPLIEHAVELAKTRGAALIVYDADAASAFSNPLPTWWSAEGEKEQFGDRLGPTELEKAGCEELSQRVQKARAQGVDAFGWLPSKRDASALADYATKQEADLLVIPQASSKRGSLTG
jgi:nucleotide-binding universal stress UspA family protein